MSTLLVPRRATPSIKAGYARSAAESANPGLWKNLVAAWIPGLGVTGLSTILDYSGNGHHGTIVDTAGAGSWSVDAKVRHNLTLPWTSYITADSAAIPMRDATNWCVSVWCYGPQDGDRGVFALYTDSADLFYMAPYFSSTDGARVSMNDNSWYMREGSGGDRRNGWHHFVHNYHAVNDAELIIDGQVATLDQYNPTNYVLSSTLDSVDITTRNRSTTYTLDGSIGPVLMHNRDLTSSEIQTLYRDPLAPFRLKPRIFSFPTEAPATTTSIISVPRRATPSLKAGYARSAAESANPGLWRGMKGAWCPMLGNTGDGVRDVRGRSHGTFGETYSPDWLVVEKGWSLRCYTTGSEFLVNNPNGAFDYGTNDFTLQIWLYPIDDKVSANPIHLGSELRLRTKSNSYLHVLGCGTGLDDTGPLVDNVWQHAAIVRRGTNVYLYRNGLERDSNTDGTTDLAESNENFFGTYAGLVEVFGGCINNIISWGRALTPQEIQHLYQDPLAPFRLKPRIIALAGEAPPVGGLPAGSLSLLGVGI